MGQSIRLRQEAQNFSKMKSLLFVALALPTTDDNNRNYITCILCKDLVGLVDNAIIGNSTIEQIEDLLEQVCGALPIGQQTCFDFVHDNLEGIIDSLVNDYLDPEELCTQLTLCP